MVDPREGPEPPGPLPLMLEQTEDRRAEKKLEGKLPPPPAFIISGVDDPKPRSPAPILPLSEGLDTPLLYRITFCVGTKSYAVWCEHNLREG